MKTFTTLALFGIATAIKLRSDEGDEACEWASMTGEEKFEAAKEWAKTEGAFEEAKAVWDGAVGDDGKLSVDEAKEAACGHLPDGVVEFVHEMADTSDDGLVDGKEAMAAAKWVKDHFQDMTWEEAKGHWGEWKKGWKGPTDGEECTETTAAQEGEEGEEGEDCDWKAEAKEHFEAAKEWAKNAGEGEWAKAWEKAKGAWKHVDEEHGNGDGKLQDGEVKDAAKEAGIPEEAALFVRDMMDTNGDGTVCGEEGCAAAEWVKNNLATLEWSDVEGAWDEWKGEETTAAQQKHRREDVKDWVKGAHEHLMGMIEEGKEADMDFDDMADWVMDHVDTNDSGDICLEEGKALGE